MTTKTETELYGIRFKSAADLKLASQLLAETCAKVEPLFGKKRLKEVGMMRSDRNPGWIIEGQPGCGEYLIRFFLDSLRKALGRDSFRVEVFKAEACALE
ncbi:MAG: hypothetical protein HY549_09645 [Elusimicrobia bacterium]|nr:hypothetical protein [Elusimicrobiota bacterium]